ncbi:unnamed protein product [Musa banksii]
MHTLNFFSYIPPLYLRYVVVLSDAKFRVINLYQSLSWGHHCCHHGNHLRGCNAHCDSYFEHKMCPEDQIAVSLCARAFNQ